MNFGEVIGPKEVVIPEQRFYSCAGCKFYDHFMVQSGQRPIYDTVCRKLNSRGEEVKDGELCLVNYNLGYDLGYDLRTPLCCPYLKSAKRNDKLDKLL